MPEPTFTLTASGDIVITRPLYAADQLLYPEYQGTIDFLKQGHAAWGTCEVQFSHRGYRVDTIIGYRVEPKVAHDLGKAGFSILSVATNHTCDYGPDAFLDTIENLRQAGITPVGGGASLDEAMTPVILEGGGMKVGVVSVCCLLPPYYAATDERPGVAPLRVHVAHEFDPILMMTEPGGPIKPGSRVDEQDMERLVAQIRGLKPKVDFVLVSVHWGFGKGDVLAEYQRPLGRAILDAGADMVLGNHMHSPSGFEMHSGKPIIYSLGNHIAQHTWAQATPRQKAIFASIDPWSILAKFTLRPGRVERIEVVPTEYGVPNVPGPITDPAHAAPVLLRLQQLCRSLGADMRIDGARGEFILG